MRERGFQHLSDILDNFRLEGCELKNVRGKNYDAKVITEATTVKTIGDVLACVLKNINWLKFQQCCDEEMEHEDVRKN